MIKIKTSKNSENVVKCDFCEELHKESKMLVLCDYDGDLWCCEDDSCRYDFSKIIKNLDVGTDE